MYNVIPGEIAGTVDPHNGLCTLFCSHGDILAQILPTSRPINL